MIHGLFHLGIYDTCSKDHPKSKMQCRDENSVRQNKMVRQKVNKSGVQLDETFRNRRKSLKKRGQNF